MSSKRPLVPPFLNHLDHELLINKPEVWSARTHLVVYYGLLFTAALTFISFIIPNDPRSSSPSPYWVGFVIIISIIALIGWLIYLLRFNVFKRYGNITPLSRLTTFILYLIATGTLFLFPMVMPYVESIRANKAYSDREITDDINSINLKICQLEYDSLPHSLKNDTVLVVNKLPQVRSLPDEEEDSIEYTPYRTYGYQLVDTASIKGRLSEADSSVRLNDSMWVLYKSKNYIFIRSYMASYHTGADMYSDFDLYKKVMRNPQQPDRRTTRAELYRILAKYRVEEKGSYSGNYYDYEERRELYDKIKEKYKLDNISNSIDNIAERKYRWRGDNAAFYVRFYFYATLVVTLLVFIYRHSTRKTFFLSLLTGILLTIITTLFAAYFTTRDTAFNLWLMAYIVLFFVISLLGFKNKTRNAVTGIGINLFVFLVFMFPLGAYSYYYATVVRENNLLPNPRYIDYEALGVYLWYAELAGPLLLLILLATYIPKVYRKWYALPEE